MRSLIDQIFDDVVEPYLAPRIRRGSIKAVKGYVASVEVARKIAIAAFGIGAVAGIAVTGVVLMLIAIIGLLPIEPQFMLYAILGLGTLMTTVSVIIAYKGFAERRWLAMSKSHELMEAAVGKWDNSLIPPDPRGVMRTEKQSEGQAPAPPQAVATSATQRAIDTSSMLAHTVP